MLQDVTGKVQRPKQSSQGSFLLPLLPISRLPQGFLNFSQVEKGVRGPQKKAYDQTRAGGRESPADFEPLSSSL